jgi:hypothetical protein
VIRKSINDDTQQKLAIESVPVIDGSNPLEVVPWLREIENICQMFVITPQRVGYLRSKGLLRRSVMDWHVELQWSVFKQRVIQEFSPYKTVYHSVSYLNSQAQGNLPLRDHIAMYRDLYYLTKGESVTSKGSKSQIPLFLLSLTNTKLATKVGEKQHEYSTLLEAMEACIAREKPMREADALKRFQIMPAKPAKNGKADRTVHGVTQQTPEDVDEDAKLAELLQEYPHLPVDDPETLTALRATDFEINAMEVWGGKQRKAGDNNCYRCGQEGHWSRNCPVIPPPDAKPKPKTENRAAPRGTTTLTTEYQVPANNAAYNALLNALTSAQRDRDNLKRQVKEQRRQFRESPRPQNDKPQAGNPKKDKPKNEREKKNKKDKKEKPKPEKPADNNSPQIDISAITDSDRHDGQVLDTLLAQSSESESDAEEEADSAEE